MVFNADTKKESWHLQVLGAHPNFQRMGIGRALIDHVAKQPEVRLFSLVGPNHADE